LNINRDVRGEGCSFATLVLNAFLLHLTPYHPTTEKLSKQWETSAIINCVYTLALSHTNLPGTMFAFLIF